MGAITCGRLAVLGSLIVTLLAACGGSPPATPSPSPGGAPTVTIESPTNGSPSPVGQPLIVTARANDAVGVGRIDLRVGGIVVDTSGPQGATMTQYTAQLQWLPTADGVETLQVIAYRTDGTPSEPATVLVAIVLPGGTLPPATGQPTGQPEPTQPAGPTPTAAARPTLPPFATPTVPPTPSPSPTATPTALDMRLEVDPLEPTTWTLGTEYSVTGRLYNDSNSIDSPEMAIRVRLCNPTGGCGSGDADVTVQTQSVGPGGAVDFTAKLTPQILGERLVRVRLQLPAGYVDPTPEDNLRELPVTVEATPP